MATPSNKKFLLGLGGVVALSFLLLAIQIKKSFSITTSHVNEPLIAANAIDIPIDQSEPLLGSPGSPITLVAYLDFGSQKNRALYTVLTEAVRKHPSDFRLVFKHAPYSSFWFQNTHTAVHTALYCAEAQGKLWAYADQLAGIASLWRNQQLTDAATAAGIKTETFTSCLATPETKANLAVLVQNSKQLAPTAPTLFVNNKKINLTTDIDLSQLLQSFIQK